MDCLRYRISRVEDRSYIHIPPNTCSKYRILQKCNYHRCCHNVHKWNKDNVASFVIRNKDPYFLEDQDIIAVRQQRIVGKNLFRLTVGHLQRFGLELGPAESILELVEKLKVAKGLSGNVLLRAIYLLTAQPSTNATVAHPCLTPPTYI